MARGARANKFSVTIDGAKELGLALENMSEEAAKILDAATRAGADIAVKAAKERAPVGETGYTKSSIHAWPQVRQKKGAGVKKLRVVRASMLVGIRKLRKGAKKKDPLYAAYTELGTKHQSPQYFLRDAVDKNKSAISAAIADTFKSAMKG